MKKIFALSLAMILLFLNSSIVYACDENQSNFHVTEVIFGDEAVSYKSNENTKMLLNALYLCSVQSDNLGQDKIDYLKFKKVGGVPSINDINIKNSALNECSHIGWDSEYTANKKVRSSRKKVLQNTVNKVFDFGLIDNLFGSESGKCNSFAALLYYSHILSDYLADDPEDTEVNLKGRSIEAYSGQAFIILNGDKPQFTSSPKTSREETIKLYDLDYLKRCIGGYAIIGKKSMDFVGPRPNYLPDPTGWKNEQYSNFISTGDIFNRCHVIAHRFCGIDNLHNLITGTRYLNDTMGIFEEVAEYIKENNENHVLYRVTPIYIGDNLIASGVQMEAYSIEDAGKLSFNVYCYNVQPGINIDYASGNSEQADRIYGSKTAIPFSLSNPSDNNPDLIYEIKKHLEVLFEDQKKSVNYTTMIQEIDSTAFKANTIGKINEKPSQIYLKRKDCEYELYTSLKRYVPILLKNEEFFKSAYK
ncbi:MAG: DNA/RNA non-specific endonuclease [Oribacterium sp.]|nr:DNA/RNA non-specific endonuclease [Oribacterium sp.]